MRILVFGGLLFSVVELEKAVIRWRHWGAVAL
jgi:hypothetical protein